MPKLDRSASSSLGVIRTASIAHDIQTHSDYLHDRLEERRAHSSRAYRSRKSDVAPVRGRDDDIFLAEAQAESERSSRLYDSSPIRGSATDGHTRKTSTASARQRGLRKTMGAREMDEYVDRLSKENFALKLELDHRKERMSKMEQSMRDMQEQAENTRRLRQDNVEWRELNEQLVEELQLRDKAVEEAVNLICELEEKLTLLEEGSGGTRPSTAQPDTGYCGSESLDTAPPSSPPQLPIRHKSAQAPGAKQCPPAPSALVSQMLGPATPATSSEAPARAPSFLSEKKPSTKALRSVFLEYNKDLNSVKSSASLLSRNDPRIEDDILPDMDVLSSPRLSVLSESSFPSIYSPRKNKPGPVAQPIVRRSTSSDEDETTPVREASISSRQGSISRVNQWMQNEAMGKTPSRVHNGIHSLSASPSVHTQLPSHSIQSHGFRSLDDTLQSSNASVSKTEQARSHDRFRKGNAAHVAQTRAEKTNNTMAPKTPTFAGSVFAEPLLPPTPDSVSTRMLRSSRSSMVDQKSLLDGTPAPARTIDALVPSSGPATRPLVGSRNEYDDKQLRASTRIQYSAPEQNTSSDEDDYDGYGDTETRTIRAYDVDYEGYPTGGSIITGTPSRFHPRHASPPTANTFNGEDIASLARLPLRRRKSSGEAQGNPRKPSILRADTSPMPFAPYNRSVSSAMQDRSRMSPSYSQHLQRASSYRHNAQSPQSEQTA
ncbi:hypothetical protein LTR66_014874, partial [Elasticomyces elasticus]